MQYKILSRAAAQKHSYKVDMPTIIISITDPDKDIARFAKNPNIYGVCRVSFDDADKRVDDEILMTHDDAKKIIDFVNRYRQNVDQIVVHCEAGMSRSAGVMAAIREWLDGDKFSVWNNPMYHPNRHCYRTMISNIFGSIV